MATNQELRHASVCEALGIAPTNYNADWCALFDDAGIAEGPFNGRLLAWINDRLSASYTSLPGAMQAFAADQGFASWDDMGTFDAAGVDPDVEAWAAAVVTNGGAAPSDARIAQMSEFVAALKADPNGWDQLSALQIFAAADSVAGRVDVRYPTRVATWGATLVFAADDYAQGNNAVDGGIDTGFNPTTDPLTLFTRNSNAAGIWIIQANTNLPVTYVPDFAEDDGSNYAYINSTDGTGNYRTPANSAADMATTNGGVTTGSFARNRTTSTLTTPYQNGVAGATNAGASAALLSQNHWIFAYRNGGAPRSNARAAMWWAGSGSLDQSVVHAAASAYLTAIGAI